MIVSVASGKGGTGKTTVSASLADVWGGPLTAVDLDVEAPNLHLFLKPEITGRETVYLETPVIDEAVCNRCGACVDLCQFKAVSILGSTIITFPEMCHGCGGCLAVCPEGAVFPGRRELGEIEQGSAGDVRFFMGRLRVGEAMSPPLMRVVKQRLSGLNGDVIIDAPPGVSCPAVSAVIDSDYILLVTEPTPFGFYDFRLAVEAFTPLCKPMGVVVNRAGLGDASVEAFCRERDLPILSEIPHDRAVAEAYARGVLAAEVNDELKGKFLDIKKALQNAGRGREARHA
jgi:MinD superfamily P-loop ATPase